MSRAQGVRGFSATQTCTPWIPGNLLSEGIMLIGIWMRTMEPDFLCFYERNVVSFQVVDVPNGDTARGDFTLSIPGAVRPLLRWTTEQRPLTIRDQIHHGGVRPGIPVLIDMEHGHTRSSEFFGNQLGAMALLGFAFTAHEEDLMAGFPSRLERLQAVAERGTQTATLVVDAAIPAIATGIVRPASKSIAHKHVVDATLRQAPGERLTGEFGLEPRIGCRPDIHQVLTTGSHDSSDKPFDRPCAIADGQDLITLVHCGNSSGRPGRFSRRRS